MNKEFDENKIMIKNIFNFVIVGVVIIKKNFSLLSFTGKI